MEIIVTKDYRELSLKAFGIMEELIKNKPAAVLGLATGSTPVGLYGLLAKACAEGEISFKEIKTVNLDEYVGLGENDGQSYVSFMRKNLFDKVDIDIKNTHLPNGKAENVEEECARYSALLKSLPRDIQLLGLGNNGHIAFNEPYTPFDSLTHAVDLTESTVKANSRLFSREEDVPKRALTMGISEITAAKKILLLASGKAKAEAVRKALYGKVDPSCPASVLQLHSDVTVIIDEEANGK